MDMVKFNAAVERGKREIMEDAVAGGIPATTVGFDELHSYVDANEYGGAFEWDGEWDDAAIEFWNAVHDAFDAWIKAGALKDVHAK